jgi:NADH-quinone oxidoreductase subunit M
VVTAVYILRVVGMMLMGPVKEESYFAFERVTWYEKFGILLMLIPIIAIGVAPLWLSEMIMESLKPFIQGVL